MTGDLRRLRANSRSHLPTFAEDRLTMGKRRAKAKKGPPEIEDAQPNDCYEAEAPLPVEEQSKNVNKRYDVSFCRQESSFEISGNTCMRRLCHLHSTVVV